MISDHKPLAITCPLQTVSGLRLEVVTVRKLEFETDAFAFADKVRLLSIFCDGCCWGCK